MKQYIVLTAETAEDLALQVEGNIVKYMPQGGVSCSLQVWTEEDRRNGGVIIMERVLFAQAMILRPRLI